MNKNLKWLVIIVATLIVGATAGSIVDQYRNTNNTLVIVAGDITLWLDGVELSKEVVITWGDTMPSYTYTKTLKVRNDANVNVKITMTTENFLTNWVQTWVVNGTTLAPLQEATGDFTLTLPVDTQAGDYFWQTIIIATEMRM